MIKKRVVWLAGGLLVTSGVAAGAGYPQAAATTPIQHVVIIYMENHSFDNVLGYWCDASPGRCPDGAMPSSVRLSDGTVVTPTTDPDTVPDVSHTVKAQLAAMNIQNGVPQMNGWQNIPAGSCAASTGYQCISGYQPGQIPNLAALAQEFALSDNTFSMADSPSWGGHLYAVMGSLDGFTGDNPVPGNETPHPGWGCDSDKVTPWVSPAGSTRWVPSCVPDPALHLRHGGAFEATPVSYHATILDELTQAGLSWRIYGAATQTAGGYDWSICPSMADCLYTSQRQNLVNAGQFSTDATAGHLPAVSIVTAGGVPRLELDSCHNKFSMTACDNYIGQLTAAAENGPDWSSTAVFIIFDDFGGFYDQVPPPLNPDGTQEGPRVPLIIVSPYARPGYTDTRATTFAGILAYVEQNFGLAPLGPNDAQAYPFTHAFNYRQKPLKGGRMRMTKLPESARHIKITNAGLRDPT